MRVRWKQIKQVTEKIDHMRLIFELLFASCRRVFKDQELYAAYLLLLYALPYMFFQRAFLRSNLLKYAVLILLHAI